MILFANFKLPTIIDARVRTPLRVKLFVYLFCVCVCGSYSVAVITSDFESENPSSNLGKSFRNGFA